MHAIRRIFQVPKLGTKLKQDSMPLSYTPRKFITHPTNNYFYMIEADHRVVGESASAKKLAEMVRLPPLHSGFDYLQVILSASKANASTKKSSTSHQRSSAAPKRLRAHGARVSASSIPWRRRQ
jgi:hypothetical protein